MIPSDHARALDALQRVRDEVHPIGDAKTKKRYRSLVRGAPAMIQRNGLGHTLAFLASKGFADGEAADSGENRGDALLYLHLGGWLARAVFGKSLDEANRQQSVRPGDANDPLRLLLEASVPISRVLRATHEAQVFLLWLRRTAEALLPDPRDEKTGRGDSTTAPSEPTLETAKPQGS